MATKKCYQHLIVMVDAFANFLWLYLPKSTDTVSVVDRLKEQEAVFGNPCHIMTYRETDITTNSFHYC